MIEKYLWDDKPYHSLTYELKHTYGQKLYKLSLDGGMTCPNRDGTIGTGGCIFCSEGGSGDFATSRMKSITEQIEEAKSQNRHKNTVNEKYIAYFQAFTNTYAPISYLREIFYEAIQHPDIAILSIATRPDCIDDNVIQLLEELNQIKPVWIELGLQTIHEATATFIRRGYPLSVFDDIVHRLSHIHVTVIVHLILGLPFESTAMILESVQHISHLPIQGVKFQLLHILKNTDLATYMDQFSILTLEEYSDLLCRCIELLPPSVVIHRITGDGPKHLLLAPLWSGNKKYVLNQIHHEMKLQQSWQGKHYKEANLCNPIL